MHFIAKDRDDTVEYAAYIDEREIPYCLEVNEEEGWAIIATYKDSMQCEVFSLKHDDLIYANRIIRGNVSVKYVGKEGSDPEWYDKDTPQWIYDISEPYNSDYDIIEGLDRYSAPDFDIKAFYKEHYGTQE